MNLKKNISSWGNNIEIRTNIFLPKNNFEIINFFKKNEVFNCITRGLGRSYGDSSLTENIISLKNYEKKIVLNDKLGTLNCSANVSINEILEIILKKGWFLNVTPGSKFVTIGGAIASDVHGKNHHKDGSFCDYVNSFKIITPQGVEYNCSKENNTDLFNATCGGMGLTGVIVSAKIEVFKIPTQNIKETIIKTNNLNNTIKVFNDYNESKYIVAWLDTNSKNEFIGRSIIFVGDHTKNKKIIQNKENRISIPFELPNFIINNYTLKLLSKIFFFKHPNYHERIVGINEFFYPLDKIKNWNRIYGSAGFVQIQILLKNKDIHKNLRKIICFFQKEKQVSFVSTLKKLGKKNKNLLSFPEDGFTITFDIKNNPNLINTYLKLEKILRKINGKIYLTKDALMTEKFFKNSYKKYSKFIKIKKKYDANLKFMSYQSKRLGIY